MDHFNATVHNGALISTRKGLVVSKSKHLGTRFVNSFASTPEGPAEPPSHLHEHIPFRPSARDDDGPDDGTFDSIDHYIYSGFPAIRISGPAPEASRTGVAAPYPAEMDTTKHTTGTSINTSIDVDSREYDGLNIASPPLSATTPQQSLNIPYIRPPVPKGNLTTHSNFIPRSQTLKHETSHIAQRLVQQYLHNVPQRSHTYEAIALVASLANGGGNVRPSELGPSIARICASINRNLLIEDDNEGRRSELAVVESIAAMAIDAVYKGRQDHWHVLMRGLRDIVDRGGGMKAEWGNTLNRIRKADVKGAAYSGSPLYLPFAKVFPSISDCLPPHRRAELAIRTEQLLQPCGVDQVNIDSIQGLAFFAQTVILARNASPRPIHFDPMGYAEDCLQVEYQLVGKPGPLRADMGAPEASSSQQVLTPNVENGPTDQNPLNALLRVAGILYIEDLLPDAHSIDLYTILLTVLIHQTGMILDRLRQGQELSSNLPSAYRPVLIWACMVGHVITTFTNAERGTCLDGGVFEDCAGVVLGSSSASDEDEADNDLSLCEMLPLAELRSVTTDEGVVLRQLIRGHEARQGRRLSAISSISGTSGLE